ncbi:UDP-N-acetylglucosamine--N-acetylmuramyl-(pentapeptide) pyrophosphoryl-undecaprenol N-acetylglucosamine transferase [Candidatus Gracilibacteria bacterium 28_42_T64]|nr:UDP-N-acetylglucosamine--N-acetylmuramyl-(pentapeptide) pyrophosphoryl-undecaprenol N-acetylglucosamine transferase [Candidatus Gracilibacteria bacterium 28_42_T64]
MSTHIDKTLNSKQTIALTGGSTGGHVFPLLSTYNYLNEERKYNFFWVGEEDSLEEEIASKNKIKFLSIPAGKVRRYFDLRNFYEPLKNLSGIVFGIFYILKYKIDIVFSKGGYVSLPLCIAAFILRKKIYVHESDMTAGIANKIIGKVATKTFYTFPNKKIDNKKYIVAGQILNPELLDYLDDLEIEENEKLEVMIIAGSQGSTTIFKTLLTILPDLQDINFNIVLGEKNMWMRDDFKKFPNILVHDFITQKRLGKILKNKDIAITRGGATTLWELNSFGIHSIIIPLKNSAGNHQLKNAEYFHSEFGSNILDEENNLDLELFRLLQKFKDLRKSGLNLENFFKPLQVIEEHIDKK